MRQNAARHFAARRFVTFSNLKTVIKLLPTCEVHVHKFQTFQLFNREIAMPTLNKTQKRNVIIASSITALIAVMVFQTTNAQSSKSDTKSVAWYVANIKAAQTKNNECRAESSSTELQATAECVNALSALQMSFK